MNKITNILRSPGKVDIFFYFHSTNERQYSKVSSLPPSRDIMITPSNRAATFWRYSCVSDKQLIMAKIHIPILLVVTVEAFASVVRGTINPGQFKKFALGKGTVGVIGQELKTPSKIQCSQR